MATKVVLVWSRFLSTPSARRATYYTCPNKDCHLRFLSTPSARRATTERGRFGGRHTISIHALCEEGDFLQGLNLRRRENISIHALCEEGDAAPCSCPTPQADFYPRPLRGGRLLILAITRPLLNDFYPRPLRGGRRDPFSVCCHTSTISIHALCEEGDLFDALTLFLPVVISIHALCEEGDPCNGIVGLILEISIHALCEEGDSFRSAPPT